MTTEIQTGQIRIIVPSTRPTLTAGRFQIPQDTFTVKARGIHIRNHKWALKFRGDTARPLTVTRAAGELDPNYSMEVIR